jgi:hypothetical protein
MLFPILKLMPDVSRYKDAPWKSIAAACPGYRYYGRVLQVGVNEKVERKSKTQIKLDKRLL